jgi:hypothetical protein
MQINEDKERLRGLEIIRLLNISREHPVENILTEALDGREKSPESVEKLYGFVLRSFGPESQVTEKFWNACETFLRDNADLTDKQLEKIRFPYPLAGQPGFRSVLEEFEL